MLKKNQSFDALRNASRLKTMEFKEYLEKCGFCRADISSESLIDLHCLFRVWKNEEDMNLHVAYDPYTREYDIAVVVS